MRKTVPAKKEVPQKLPRSRPLAERRLHRKFRAHEAKALEELEMAKIYLNDGAYASAARYFRLAAAELETAQMARNDAFILMSGQNK